MTGSFFIHSLRFSCEQFRRLNHSIFIKTQNLPFNWAKSLSSNFSSNFIFSSLNRSNSSSRFTSNCLCLASYISRSCLPQKEFFLKLLLHYCTKKGIWPLLSISLMNLSFWFCYFTFGIFIRVYFSFIILLLVLDLWMELFSGSVIFYISRLFWGWSLVWSPTGSKQMRKI